jgi:multiple sugar transport system substrate-binding protein
MPYTQSTAHVAGWRWRGRTNMRVGLQARLHPPGRRCWSLVVFAIVLMAAGASIAVAAPKTITVWSRSAFNLTSPDKNALEAAAAAFNRAQRAYRVEVLAANYGDFAEWVHGVAVTGTLPCLLELDGPFVAEFAWPGYLQPLDKFISAELRRDLLPSILAQGIYAGHLYSLGQFDSGLGLWANRRYLEAAGVRIPSVARPWTLAEFEHAMDRLARVKGVDYPLDLAVYTGTSEFSAYAYLPILAGFGGDFIDRKTQWASGVLDGPQSVAAMSHFHGWFRNGWARAVARTDDFQAGRAALAWTGHWRYHPFREALGNDLILLPLPDFGRGLRTGVGSWSWSITSTCPEPAGAWAFLSHLMSTQEILRMTNANGAIPARRSALARSPLYGSHGPLHVFTQQLFFGAGYPRPSTPGYGTISRAFAAAVAAIIAGSDVQAELTRAARTIDEDVAANRGYPQ